MSIRGIECSDIVLGIQKVIRMCELCECAGRPEKALIFHVWLTLKIYLNTHTHTHTLSRKHTENYFQIIHFPVYQNTLSPYVSLYFSYKTVEIHIVITVEIHVIFPTPSASVRRCAHPKLSSQASLGSRKSQWILKELVSRLIDMKILTKVTADSNLSS